LHYSLNSFVFNKIYLFLKGDFCQNVAGELEKRRKTLSKFTKSKKMNKGVQQKGGDKGAQGEGPTKSWPHRVNHFIAIPIRNKQVCFLVVCFDRT